MPIQTFFQRYQFAPDTRLEQDFARLFRHRHYASQVLLGGPTQVADRLYFIEKGAVQRFYVDQHGDEVTVGFAVESEIILSPSGLFWPERPPADYLRALEPLSVYELTYTDMRLLQQNHHAFALLSLQLSEETIGQYEGRARMLHNADPATRYAWYLANHRKLGNRVQVQQVASYLGLSRFTMSRLRRRSSKE